MISDYERREVAARLRELDYTDLQESLICAYLDALGIEGYEDWVGIAHRLADLIEPNRGSAERSILCAHCESASWCGCEPGDEEGGCDFEPSVTEGEPPCNLYSLYEAVLRRRPRGEYAIEDDEVDELVDALLDICNAPGHEHIRRSEPAYPDATASCKGWRAEVYDPDGVLASPSNVAADLVRAHTDGKRPSEPEVRCAAEVKVDGEQLEKLVHDAVVKLTGIDRDALLELADEMERKADEALDESAHSISEAVATSKLNEYTVRNGIARRIREALGVNE